MFYQDNKDYMRDSYFYGMNPYMQNNFQMPMNQNFMNLENMYPQIYRIINPVVNRVIGNTNYPYITEDTLNNMTDTIYNIVEGDVSSLSMQEEVTQAVNANANSNNRSQNSNNPTTDRRSNNSNNNSSSELLRDLIKIILIKELLSRRNYMQNQGGLPMSYYNPMGYGLY